LAVITHRNPDVDSNAAPLILFDQLDWSPLDPRIRNLFVNPGAAFTGQPPEGVEATNFDIGKCFDPENGILDHHFLGGRPSATHATCDWFYGSLEDAPPHIQKFGRLVDIVDSRQQENPFLTPEQFTVFQSLKQRLSPELRRKIGVALKVEHFGDIAGILNNLETGDELAYAIGQAILWSYLQKFKGAAPRPVQITPAASEIICDPLLDTELSIPKHANLLFIVDRGRQLDAAVALTLILNRLKLSAYADNVAIALANEEKTIDPAAYFDDDQVRIIHLGGGRLDLFDPREIWLDCNFIGSVDATISGLVYRLMYTQGARIQRVPTTLRRLVELAEYFAEPDQEKRRYLGLSTKEITEARALEALIPVELAGLIEIRAHIPGPTSIEEILQYSVLDEALSPGTNLKLAWSIIQSHLNEAAAHRELKYFFNEGKIETHNELGFFVHEVNGFNPRQIRNAARDYRGIVDVLITEHHETPRNQTRFNVTVINQDKVSGLDALKARLLALDPNLSPEDIFIHPAQFCFYVNNFTGRLALEEVYQAAKDTLFLVSKSAAEEEPIRTAA
jgi:hypothetical protein